jgi:hypothetical protein
MAVHYWGDSMFSDSVLYTVGTALNRALDSGVPVQILVEGQWISGRVGAVDGHGVVLASEHDEHCVIRIQSVAAVKMFAPAPGSAQRAPITAAPSAMPMPSSYAPA